MTTTETSLLRQFGADGGVRDLGPAASGFAIHPDGPLYRIEEVGPTSRDLAGIDIGMGAGLRVHLPDGTITLCDSHENCSSGPIMMPYGTPTVLADGTVAVPYLTGYVNGCYWSYMCPGTDQTMQVLQARPDGTTTSRVALVSGGSDQNLYGVYPYKAVPNGAGGLFVLWDDWRYLNASAGDSAEAIAESLRPDGTATGVAFVGSSWNGGGIVLGENGVVLAVANGYSHTATADLNYISRLTTTGFIVDANEFETKGVTSLEATVGGGFVTSYTDGTVSGPDSGFDLMHLRSMQPVDQGSYVGHAAEGVVTVVGPDILTNPTVWSSAQGGFGATNAASRDCGEILKTALMAEYELVPSLKVSCGDFQPSGPHGPHADWSVLSGQALTHKATGGRRISDNLYPYAIVTIGLRDGFERTWTNYNVSSGGQSIRVSGGYRTPKVNETLPGHATASPHMIGLAADMRPTNLTTSELPRPTWDQLANAARGPNVVLEDWKDGNSEEAISSRTHVHARFPKQ